MAMDPKELAFQHFEKGILAALVVWLAVSIFSVASPPAELKTNVSVQGKLGQLSDYMLNTEPPAFQAPTWAEDVKRVLDPTATTRVEPQFYPAWLAWRRPNLACKGPDTEARPNPVLGAPLNFRGTVSRGRIDLSWALSDQNSLVIVEKFELHRRELPNGKWELLKELKREEKANEPPLSYSDDPVPPRTKFEYKLVQSCSLDLKTLTDREIKKWDLKPPAPTEAAWQSDVETPRDLYIVPVPNSAEMPDAAGQLQGKKPKVTLKVYKCLGGEWGDPKIYNAVEEGAENIGKVETVRNKKIDFSTGAKLLEVRVEEKEVVIAGNKIKKKVTFIKIKWPGVDAPEEMNDYELPQDLAKPGGKPPKKP